MRIVRKKTPRPSRKPADKYHHGDLRRSILAAARDLLSEGGASSLSLRECAERAGVSKSAPYRHFRDKEDLLAALAEECYQGLREYMETAIRAAPANPLSRAEAAGVAYVEYAVANPAQFNLLFGPGLPDWTRYPALGKQGKEILELALTEVGKLMDMSGNRVSDPALVTIGAWSLVHGLAAGIINNTLAPLGIDYSSPAEFTRNLIRAMLAQAFAFGRFPEAARPK